MLEIKRVCSISRVKREAKSTGEMKRRERDEGRHCRLSFSAAIDVFFFDLDLFQPRPLQPHNSPLLLPPQKKTSPVVSFQLAPQDELNWDDGSANPEYCVDRWDDVGKYQALKWLLGGLGVFGGALTLATVLDKRSTIPFAPRDYPFDSLKSELNGSKGVGPRD